jgi:hypothetical protein
MAGEGKPFPRRVKRRGAIFYEVVKPTLSLQGRGCFLLITRSLKEIDPKGVFDLLRKH